MNKPLPAHSTKHIPSLDYSFEGLGFHLKQIQDGVENGTTLWIGGQIMAIYLSSLFKGKSSTTNISAIELGSGIGLTALAMAAIGFDVIATDQPSICASVLRSNISNNASILAADAKIQARELDWTVDPELWSWNDPVSISSPRSNADISSLNRSCPIQPPFDLIFSSDTIYSPALVAPLLRAIQVISSVGRESTTSHTPQCYLCLERRDPELVDLFFDTAREMGFTVARIPPTKVARAVAKSKVDWQKDDWEGVEIWKMQATSRSSCPP